MFPNQDTLYKLLNTSKQTYLTSGELTRTVLYAAKQKYTCCYTYYLNCREILVLL